MLGGHLLVWILLARTLIAWETVSILNAHLVSPIDRGLRHYRHCILSYIIYWLNIWISWYVRILLSILGHVSRVSLLRILVTRIVLLLRLLTIHRSLYSVLLIVIIRLLRIMNPWIRLIIVHYNYNIYLLILLSN